MIDIEYYIFEVIILLNLLIGIFLLSWEEEVVVDFL